MKYESREERKRGWKMGEKKKKGGGNVPVARRSREVYRAFEFMYSQSCTVPAILRLSPLVLLCSLSIRFVSPPRYHERNVRRRRKRPATVEDISRVVYDSLRKEFNDVDVWILRFCVKVGYEDGVWKYWYSHWRERRFLLCFG